MCTYGEQGSRFFTRIPICGVTETQGHSAIFGGFFFDASRVCPFHTAMSISCHLCTADTWLALGSAGSDTARPFNCPADYVFNIENMDKFNNSYRLPGFLEHPRVPSALRASTTDVLVMDSSTTADGLSRASTAAASTQRPQGLGPRPSDRWHHFVASIRNGGWSAGSAVRLPRGFTAQQLSTQLAPHSQAAFIRLRGFGPGRIATMMRLLFMALSAPPLIRATIGSNASPAAITSSFIHIGRRFYRQLQPL